MARVAELGLTGKVRELVREAERVRSLSKRRGRARGGGQSSKAKGRVGCQMAQEAILKAFPALSLDDVWVKATSQSGTDLHLSPHAQTVLPFGIEVKRVESLNIWAAMAQAEVNAAGKPFLVIFSRAGSPLYVALSAEEFLRWVSRTQSPA